VDKHPIERQHVAWSYKERMAFDRRENGSKDKVCTSFIHNRLIPKVIFIERKVFS
jgi:hypothetical protein